MKVYIVTHWYDHEGSTIDSVWANKDAAEACARELGRDIEITELDRSSARHRHSLGIGLGFPLPSEGYEVEEYEVQGEP